MNVPSCSLVDEGRNPDLFTRDFLEQCLAKNEATKGRVDAFKVSLASCFLGHR
jgi:hypothetical protein